MKKSENTESTSKARASKPKQHETFTVKTKGYKESFNSIDKAKDQFEILKKRAIKNRTAVKIDIVDQRRNVVDHLSINENFYEND